MAAIESQPVKVLLVEDSEDDVKLVLRALRRGGFAPAHTRVQTAADFTAALAGGHWDAVISDFSMPGFTGLDALRIFRSTGVDIPFILVSGTIGEEFAADAMKAGASDYVMKSNLARLAPALNRELMETQMRAAHRQAQRDLAESEQRLRTVIETEPECVKVVSREGVLLEMNAAGLAMLEAGSLVAAQSRPLLEFVVPEHRAAFAALHRRVIGGESGILEFEVIGLKGGRRWLETHAAPLSGASAGETMLLGIARDITESKRASDELRESEARFRSLTELSSDFYWETDTEHRMLHVSHGRQHIPVVGTSQHGKTRWEVPSTHPDTAGWAAHRAILDARAPFRDFEFSRLGAEGTERHISINGEPVFDEYGTFKGYRGVGKDITQRKKAEEKILRLNRVYAVLSGINSAIVRIRERGELFTEACRIAVTEGGFIVARVIELDAQGKARIAATSGPDSRLYHRIVDRYNSDPEHCDNLLAHALRSGQPLISNDVAKDSRIATRAALTKDGNYALALLPMIVDERVAGAIVLRAREAGMFDQEELSLLLELTGNIALALDRIEKEESLNTFAAERLRGDEALRRFSAAMDATSDAIYLVDRSTMRFVHVNEAACRMQGCTRGELLALGPDGVLGASRAELERIYDAIIASGEPAEPTEMLRTRRDGSQVWVELRRHAQASGEGWTIVTLVRDITDQKARDGELQRFRAAMDASGDGILLMDRASMRYIDVNQTLCDLIGRTRHELIGMTPMDIFGADRQTLERDYDALIKDNNSSANLVEGEYHHKDGSVIPIETRRRALRTDNGWVIVGTARDITERKAAEDRIIYLNRVYAVLSGINTLIVRVRDRNELFREACRIAVEAGGFRMAWIGIVDPSALKIVPVASAGVNEELLTGIKGLFSSSEGTPLGNSKAAQAIREKKAVVSNDSQSDPRVVFGKKHGESEFRSMAILPLIVSDDAVGVLVLYAAESEFFREEELKLLTELAGDIAFAIDHIGKQARLDYLAYYDELTGLANRSLFLERVAQYMRSAASGGHNLVLFVLDIERFKNINDSLGRSAGDSLLKQVAEWLTRDNGDANLVARIGADHFATVLPEVSPENGVRSLEKSINAFLEHPFGLNDAVFRIAVKVGIAVFPKDGSDADTLLRNAEAALKKAKARGDRYLFYKQKMTERVAGKLTLENKLRSALEKEEFVLHYQPKVGLQGAKLMGAEALIRWNDPDSGLVPPGHFIPILEETGLIHDVGRWALRRALEDYLRWRAAGLPAVRIAVNVSPLQLRSRGFIAEIGRAIGGNEHAAAGLELEITESVIMADVKHSIATLQAIRDMKVSIAIDDFGTGFSSLAYLAKLPVDTLKIDRSFVIDMTSGPDGLSLVSTIINLAHALKLKVVAEGVETEEQSRLLRLLNCNEMQGFLFSKPVPAEVFEAKFLGSARGT